MCFLLYINLYRFSLYTNLFYICMRVYILFIYLADNKDKKNIYIKFLLILY